MTESMNQLINQLITKVFVEQPLALPGSAKYEKTGALSYKALFGEWKFFPKKWRKSLTKTKPKCCPNSKNIGQSHLVCYTGNAHGG